MNGNLSIKELFWPMTDTLGKVGREIRVGRRWRAESETDCSSRPRRSNMLGAQVSHGHGHVADRLMKMG